MEWMRMRVTPTLPFWNEAGVRLLLAERSDGGVFYVEILLDSPLLNITEENNLYGKWWDLQLQNALFSLDRFLEAPLLDRSVGQFEMNPPFWL